MEQASCRSTQVDPDVFFPDDRSELLKAQTICASCPVRSSCLEFGQENDETGVWGGWYLKEGYIKKYPFNGRKIPQDDSVRHSQFVVDVSAKRVA